MRKPVLLLFFLLLFLPLLFSFHSQQLQWKKVETVNEPEARLENAFVRVGQKFYLLGGRQQKTIDCYDPATKQWIKLSMVPLEMHHFQAVAYNGEIYVMGAFTGNYPHETPIPDIYIYNPQKDQWRKGSEIPAARRRGAAGVTLYKDKFYIVCGITDGHYDGQVAWLDEYDPKTDTWRQLPDAPHKRDHIQVAVADNKILVAAGRLSSAKTGKVLENTIAAVDVFDFKNNTWKTLPESLNIPTQRAGSTAVALGSKVLIIGGESPQLLAHNETEAFDFRTNTWEKLAPLNTGRHGTGSLVYQNKVYVAAGCGKHGGEPALNSMEVLE